MLVQQDNTLLSSSFVWSDAKAAEIVQNISTNKLDKLAEIEILIKEKEEVISWIKALSKKSDAYEELDNSLEENEVNVTLKIITAIIDKPEALAITALSGIIIFAIAKGYGISAFFSMSDKKFRFNLKRG